MRIGIDARFYGSVGKGLGRYTEKLIENLELFDQENEYVIFLMRENFDEYTPRNTHFHKVLAEYPWYSIAEQILFPIALLRFRLDVVHFPHFNVPMFYPKKFIVTIHDLILLHYPTLRSTTRSVILYAIKFLAYRLVIALAMRRAEHIIAVSHFTANDIVRHAPYARDKVSVTYEAADAVCQWLSLDKEYALLHRLHLFAVEQSEMPRQITRDILKPYLLYVGNAYPHKNLEALLAIAPLFPMYMFVLVGKEDYFYTRLKKRARAQNVHNVLFTGFVNDRELNTLYRFARCYLFPSLYEGFGLPPLEAMTHGLPVLSSQRGSLPEVLGEAARYFDPTQEGSLAKELKDMLDSETAREQYARLGYKQAARYSWKTMARETLTLYRKSVENKNR
ncbi:MAG TPA: glycosyltransferase family 1 protein [Patescibacteria group bacterium]|nr:glycosyltransferase family 1 protein [Patescibacteria group bacterium]